MASSLPDGCRGRLFRVTPEQVPDHLLQAPAFGPEMGLSVKVQHHDRPYWEVVAVDAGASEPESR
jgi:hypothetical protein